MFNKNHLLYILHVSTFYYSVCESGITTVPHQRTPPQSSITPALVEHVRSYMGEDEWVKLRGHKNPKTPALLTVTPSPI